MRFQGNTLSALVGAFLSLCVAMILLTSTGCVGARYLPTRADESDVEVLKEIIRELVSQSALEASESHLNRFNQANLGRLFQQGDAGQRAHFLLDRQSRAAELPQSSNGDNSVRLMTSG